VVAIIEQDPGLRVAAEACTVDGAVACFSDARPDVTLISLRPRGLNSLEVLRAIRQIDTDARIVVYAENETEAVYAALGAGATGLLLREAGPADLTRVITEVHRRNGATPDNVRSRPGTRSTLPTLTTRQVEVLELITRGLRSKAISETLRISEHTVKMHMKSTYEKLGVHGRAAALAEALRRGLVRIATEQGASDTILAG
jgi:DNA-binding NarL/FixJ family response regulator